MRPQLRSQECVDLFSHSSCDAQIKQLIKACKDKNLRSALLKGFHLHPLLKIHDIARALYLLIALEEGIDLGVKFLNLQQESSGAVRLFRYGGFPWRGLPYPAEHAELGLLLLQISEFYEETFSWAGRMSSFQQSVFSHKGDVFPALWSQQYARCAKEKTFLSKSLLHQTGRQLINSYTFHDPGLGFWMKRTHAISGFVAGSGCKSGVGAYYTGDVGVANYGPETGDSLSCQGFGISGSVKEFLYQKDKDIEEITFISSLVRPNARNTGFTYLKDAYLGPRVRHQIRMYDKGCYIRSRLQERKEGFTYSLFCKGKTCHILGGPRLRAGSLDSYQGPVYKVVIRGERDALSIRVSGSKMKIVSLHNENDFWGSHFLINIPYEDFETSIVLEKV